MLGYIFFLNWANCPWANCPVTRWTTAYLKVPVDDTASMQVLARPEHLVHDVPAVNVLQDGPFLDHIVQVRFWGRKKDEKNL